MLGAYPIINITSTKCPHAWGETDPLTELLQLGAPQTPAYRSKTVTAVS